MNKLGVSKRTARAFVAPADCRDCGRCCFSEESAYLAVFAFDLARMDERARGFTRVEGDQRYMRLEAGHCSALQLDPVKRRFVCGIYEARPDVCRQLAQGSGACGEQWRDKAGLPDVALERLRRTTL
jgi:Fe-S-cluster containining protein